MRIPALLAALLLTWADPALAGHGPAGVHEGQAVSIPLQRTRLGHYTIALELDRPVAFGPQAAERRTIRLILDTGASHTALRAPVAEQLNDGAPFARTRLAHSTTGPFLTDRLTLHDADFGAGTRDIDAVVLPEAGGALFGSHGFLGASAFTGERIEIDFARSRLVIDPQRPVRRHLSLDRGRRLVTGRARVQGVDEPVRVLIDTGSNASVANSALEARRSGPSAVSHALVNGVDVSGAARAQRRRLFGGLELGELCAPMFWITVLDVHAFDTLGWTDAPAMIIGADMLQNATLRIDYATGAVEIEGAADTACRRTH